MKTFQGFRVLIAAVLSVVLSSTAVAETGYKVAYDGGSVQEKVGTEAYLYLNQDRVTLATKKGQTLSSVPAAAITEISYGQDSTAGLVPQ